MKTIILSKTNNDSFLPEMIKKESILAFGVSISFFITAILIWLGYKTEILTNLTNETTRFLLSISFIILIPLFSIFYAINIFYARNKIKFWPFIIIALILLTLLEIWFGSDFLIMYAQDCSHCIFFLYLLITLILLIPYLVKLELNRIFIGRIILTFVPLVCALIVYLTIPYFDWHSMNITLLFIIPGLALLGSAALGYVETKKSNKPNEGT